MAAFFRSLMACILSTRGVLKGEAAGPLLGRLRAWKRSVFGLSIEDEDVLYEGSEAVPGVAA